MENKNFEEMYKRLEKIAKDIQGENLTLDDVHKLYAEGIDTADKCLAYINELKRKVDSGRTIE